jgi:hypothetical protein
MILSTHRSTDPQQHPRHGFWSIALIIVISALLAVLIEPLFPNPAIAAHSESAHTVQTAADNQ